MKSLKGEEYHEMSFENPLLPVIIGGFLAILGGIAGVWIQARFARGIKMDEIIAEKSVDAVNEAYGRIVTIKSMINQSELKDVKQHFYHNDVWFFKNQLFLPVEFVVKWKQIEGDVIKGAGLERDRPGNSDELSKLYKNLLKLTEEAIGEIYKAMKLKKIDFKERLFEENY